MLLATAPAAAAQTGNPALDSPADALSRNLRSLAENPKSLHALMGAGTAALALGDAQAAITFFARAEEQAPRDGRVKMWIGAALVQLQQPKSAMRFFREAAGLGVAEADIAAHRGLAHDISGNPAAAQRDYRLALQRGADPETTRRLALSLGISGQREAALRLLEDQLLRRDAAAERSRALILAMTGDSDGAARAVQARMPGPQAAAMTSFLARLPLLTPAERALAVHLGVFPGDAGNAPPQTYAAFQPTLNAGAPDMSKPSLARRTPPPEPVSTEPRRRPGTATAARDARGKRGTETAARDTRGSRSAPETGLSRVRGTLTSTRRGGREERKPAATSPRQTQEPVQSAAALPVPAAQQPPAPPATREPVQTAAAAVPVWTPPPVEPRPRQSEPSAQAERPAVLAGVQSLPQASATPLSSSPQPARAEIEPAARAEPIDAEASLAALSATVASLAAETPRAEEKPWLKAAATPPKVEEKPWLKPAEPPKAEEPKPWLKPAAAAKKPEPEKLAAAGKKAPEKKPAAERKAPEKKAAAKKPEAAEPARHWVQVAGGANKAALPREFARLKAKAAKLLGSRTAWTTPLNATNRLLVGPFKTGAEAQAFVNDLAKADLSAFAWTSEAGQKIEKLPAK